MIHKLILPYREESNETTKMSKNKPTKKMEPGTCLDLATGDEGHSCDGRYCMGIQSFMRRGLATWFGDTTEKRKKKGADTSRLLREYQGEFGDGSRGLLEDV